MAESSVDLMEESFSQKQLEDLSALHPELQHLHIMVLSTQPQVSRDRRARCAGARGHG